MTDPMKDLVVLIPGIGGSVLQRDGHDIWAFSAGAALRGVLSLGESVKRLELHGDDAVASDLGDGIKATRLMPDLHVVPGLGWKIDGYTKIKERLFQRFDCRAGHNYFEFPYDWRRDNRAAARLLAVAAKGWLKSWREESGHADAKLVLLGHSMGGIVARFFLESAELEGWKDTRTLITFGTPYSGSLNALDFLVNGFKKGFGPFSINLSPMLRSFTSVYQLLPSYRCLEGPNDTWLRLDDVDWAGTGIDDGRLKTAIKLQRDLRSAVDARIAVTGRGYDVRPVVGDFQDTGWAARRTGKSIEVMAFRRPEEEGGDGTVPKVSAVPHESLAGWVNATFVAQKHGSLQNDEPVFNHLAGVLRSDPIGPDVFPAADDAIALEVDDVTTEEPFVVRARPAQGGTELRAVVTPLGGGKARSEKLHATADGWHELVVTGLPARDYRVSVNAVGSRTVTDVASVIDLAEVAAASG